MANEQTGVKVMVTAPRESDFYEGATDIRVTDGHLYVYKGRAGSSHSQTMAIYAPNKWLHAKVTS